MEARIRAYIEGLESGRFNTQRAYVYDYIKQGYNTLEQLDFIFDNNRKYTGRLSELEELGVVKKVDKGGQFSFYEIVNNPDEQLKLQKKYRVKMFKKWLKKGREFYDIHPDIETVLSTFE